MAYLLKIRLESHLSVTPRMFFDYQFTTNEAPDSDIECQFVGFCPEKCKLFLPRKENNHRAQDFIGQ